MKNTFLKYFLLYVAIIIAIWWTWHIFQPKYSTTEPALDMWVLNVGQGESILIREPSGKKLLFDGGPNDSVLSELGEILPPWERTIDLLILSHPHADHIRGLISVLERYDVKEVWTSGSTYTTADYRAWLDALNREGISPTYISFPHAVTFGDITLRAYHPLENMEGKQPRETHDGNLSVKASYFTQDIFLTGDLEEHNEKEMVEFCQPPSCDLEAEVLQIPHHGSANGLLPEFLAAVSPKVAVIPVGKDNRFDHPRPIVLERLANAAVTTYRTDNNGRIHLVFTKDTIEAK